MSTPPITKQPTADAHLQGIDLRTFAELQEAERAYLSLYASSKASLNQLSQRAERIRNLLGDSPDELAYFERNLDLIRDWLDDNGYANDFPANGLCVFACELLDYVQGIALPVPPENAATHDTLRVGSSPYLRPLAELRDEYENFLVVVADNKSTRILQVASARAQTANSVRGNIKNHVRKGGWSQQRYERRRDKALHDYAKEINGLLGDLVRGGRFERIVLLGAQETLTELRDVLSTEIAERVIGQAGTNQQDDDDALLADAYALFFEEERDEEQRLWARIREQSLADGLAATGPAAVLDALKLGRAAEVLVTRDAELTGTQCQSCENVTVPGNGEQPDACPICESADVVPLDLVDELVRQAELTSASVEFSDEIGGLSSVGEVAATLRY